MSYSINPYKLPMSREMSFVREDNRESGLVLSRLFGRVSVFATEIESMTTENGLYIPRPDEVSRYANHVEPELAVDDIRVVDTLEEFVEVASSQLRNYYDAGYQWFGHGLLSESALPEEELALHEIANDFNRYASGDSEPKPEPRAPDSGSGLRIGFYL